MPQKTLNLGSIFNGIHFKAKLETVPGTTATADREKADSYTVEVSVKVTVPLDTAPDVVLTPAVKVTAVLSWTLPSLAVMVSVA